MNQYAGVSETSYVISNHPGLWTPNKNQAEQYREMNDAEILCNTLGQDGQNDFVLLPR